MHRRFLSATLAVTAVMIGACNPAVQTDSSLSSADLAAIRSLDDKYVAGWLDSDTLAVLSTLAEDAILMPSGQRPIVGIAEIRAFWWPDDGSRTEIVDYIMEIDELDGDNSFAYSRGSAQLSFQYEKNGQVTEHKNSSMSLTVYQKRDGEWRIFRRMWGPIQ